MHIAIATAIPIVGAMIAAVIADVIHRIRVAMRSRRRYGGGHA